MLLLLTLLGITLEELLFEEAEKDVARLPFELKVFVFGALALGFALVEKVVACLVCRKLPPTTTGKCVNATK
jgi:hypothetical protein